MAYVGTAPANRVLSSADIAQGSVTLDDINFTDQPTNMDITGTIDKHTMRLADGVTITGDVTISDDLVLSKISDDGNAITMTNDGSSRTITGSGSIEASTLSQTPNQSLTGMTGTIGSAVTNNAGVASGVIGSAVTGSPAINLENATFQTGHIIQTIVATHSTATSALTETSFSASGDVGVSGSIIPKSTSNKILIFLSMPLYIERATTAVRYGVRIYRSASGSTDAYLNNQPTDHYRVDADNSGTTQLDFTTQHNMNALDTGYNTSGSAVTYTVHVAIEQSANSMTITAQKDNMPTILTLMEIQG